MVQRKKPRMVQKSTKVAPNVAKLKTKIRAVLPKPKGPKNVKKVPNLAELRLILLTKSRTFPLEKLRGLISGLRCDLVFWMS